MESVAIKSTDLAKSYDHAAVQAEVSAVWDAHRLWHAEPDPTRPTFVICIPPPNVTAALHLGHAFNNTLQDILVRKHRMQGLNAVWLPGTDHAGIATQTVVEKRVQREEGKRRTDYSRDEFVAKIQSWKDEYETKILSQLKAMSCSCDWDRTAFTMDARRSAAVREAFFRLFKDGLIYRGKRLVNWDPVTLTALADDEVENEEIDGFFYYLKYPLADGSGTVTVATTRPETMLGDTAVAVNPTDPRAAALTGKKVILPLVKRTIPIIADEYVVLPIQYGGDDKDPKARLSSGFLKVTPAHDDNDFKLGEKHKLKMINVMAPNASISLDHGWADAEPAQRENPELSPFVGLSREKAREAIVAWFKQNGLLEKVVPYRHSVGHSYRSHVPVEPYLSDQWYVAVQKPIPNRGVSLAQLALEALEQHGLKFVPERYAKTYHNWNANLRDWCISRQLWWGHRIPVWQLDPHAKADASAINAMLAGGNVALNQGDLRCVCVRGDQPAIERQLASLGYVQDADVLDTWFSSALWPMSTMGWPQNSPGQTAELAAWNPTSVLCTAREIITLWVSRMVMFNRYLIETDKPRLPFKDVFVHAMIQDGHGQKMSKSLGNGVDPLDIIPTHGVDAMRFTLAHMATLTQDARMPVDMVDPFTGETFTPPFVTNAAGYTVAQPVIERNGKKFASSYGASVGEAGALTVARNTSSKFDMGRNFANKLWNAARFVLMQIKDAKPGVDESKWSTIDRWILSRLARTVQACNDQLADYRFDQYAKTLHDFVWRDLCDWYLEAAKPAMRDPHRRDPTSLILATCLDQSLRLLHPVMPLITERLWWALNDIAPVRGIDTRFVCEPSQYCMTAKWPEFTGMMNTLTSYEAEHIVAQLQELVVAIRELRNTNKADPKKKVPVTIAAPAEVVHHIEANKQFLELLAVCEIVKASSDATEPPGSSKTSAASCAIFVEGLIDSGSSQKRKAELSKTIAGLQGRLSNQSYIAKAPPKLVEETRQQLANAQAELAKLGGS